MDPENSPLIKIPEFLSTPELDSVAAQAACDPMAEWCGIHQEPCTTTCETVCQSCQTTCEFYCQTCQSACQITSQCGSCETVSQGPVYTPSTFTISNITSTSATINVRLGSGYSQFRVFCRLTSDPNSSIYNEIVNSTTNFSKLISGLSPNTNYTVNVDNMPGGGWSGGQIFDTLRTAVTPWSWAASNGSASSAQTVAMYNAIKGTRTLDGLSYLVWNDLCNKINETAVAKGASWLNNYGSLSETRMGANKDLTARKFNALRYNVGAWVSTGIAEVGIDGSIRWEHFLIITEKLNQWIAM